MPRRGLVMAWVVLTVAVVYNFSFGRLLFVSGMEKRLPHQIGKVNRNKVPANAITLQSAISTVLAILVFFVLGGGTADPYKYFYILYAGVTIVWCISTALLFLDIFFAKRAEPERFERERRVPVGWLYLCGVVGFVVNILAVLFIFVGSWYPAGFPTLSEWNAWMIGFTAVSVISGIVIWFVSQSARRGKSDEELIAEGIADRRDRRGPAWSATGLGQPPALRAAFRSGSVDPEAARRPHHRCSGICRQVVRASPGGA